MSFIFLAICVLSFAGICVGQTVLSQKEAERLHKLSIEETRISKLYFAEIDKCRTLLAVGSFVDGETVCGKAAAIAEKFPAGRKLEKSSAYTYTGIAQLRQEKTEAALANFEKAMTIANRSDDDADKGDLYFLIGQAHYQADRTEKAREFYSKAEATIRAAFVHIEDDEIRGFYPKRIRRILNAHIALLEDNALRDEAVKMQKRLEDFEKEFAKYLEDEN